MKIFNKKIKFLCFGKPQKCITFASSGNIEEDLKTYLVSKKEAKDPEIVFGGPGQGIVVSQTENINYRKNNEEAKAVSG